MLGHTKSLLLSAVVLVVPISVSSLTLSESCSNSLQSLVRSEEAACLNAGALVGSIIGSQETKSSAPTIVEGWLKQVCNTGKCSNENLAKIVANVTTGCSGDLKPLGIDLSSNKTQSDIIAAVQKFYTPVRQMLCLKDDTTNQFCPVQTLQGFDKALGGLNLENLVSAVMKTISPGGFDLPKELTCSDCMKSTFNLARSSLSTQLDLAAEDKELSKFCGAAFIDGNYPTTVSQSAPASAFVANEKAGNSAATSSPITTSGMVLALVFTAFAVLA